MKNSITKECVESSIASEEYLTLGKKTTCCVITLKNGFEIVGTSACIDASNYDIEVGKPYARKKAIDQVWTALASKLQFDLAESECCEKTECCKEGISTAPDAA